MIWTWLANGKCLELYRSSFFDGRIHGKEVEGRPQEAFGEEGQVFHQMNDRE